MSTSISTRRGRMVTEDLFWRRSHKSVQVTDTAAQRPLPVGGGLTVFRGAPETFEVWVATLLSPFPIIYPSTRTHLSKPHPSTTHPSTLPPTHPPPARPPCFPRLLIHTEKAVCQAPGTERAAEGRQKSPLSLTSPWVGGRREHQPTQTLCPTHNTTGGSDEQRKSKENRGTRHRGNSL